MNVFLFAVVFSILQSLLAISTNIAIRVSECQSSVPLPPASISCLHSATMRRLKFDRRFSPDRPQRGISLQEGLSYLRSGGDIDTYGRRPVPEVGFSF